MNPVKLGLRAMAGLSLPHLVWFSLFLLLVMPLISGFSREQVSNNYPPVKPVEMPPPVPNSSFGVPKPLSNYVNDYAQLLERSEMKELFDLLEKARFQTGTEITLVIVRDLATFGAKNTQGLAAAFFNAWGVGDPARKDGILILVAVAERAASIETGADLGAGDRAAFGHLIESRFSPSFKKGKIAEGILKGTRGVVEAAVAPRPFYKRFWFSVVMYSIGGLFLGMIILNFIQQGSEGWAYALFYALGVTIVMMLFSGHRRGRRRGWASHVFGGGFSSGGGGAGGSW